MGIQGGSGFADNDSDDGDVGNNTTQFVQDINITFTMSGTSDNGLTFGAAIDLSEDAGDVDTDDAGVAIFVSGDFGTLTLGDTDGRVRLGPAGSRLRRRGVDQRRPHHACRLQRQWRSRRYL